MLLFEKLHYFCFGVERYQTYSNIEPYNVPLLILRE